MIPHVRRGHCFSSGTPLLSLTPTQQAARTHVGQPVCEPETFTEIMTVHVWERVKIRSATDPGSETSRRSDSVTPGGGLQWEDVLQCSFRGITHNLAGLRLNSQATVQFHARDVEACTSESRPRACGKAADAIKPGELQVSQAAPHTCQQREPATKANRIHRIQTNRASLHPRARVTMLTGYLHCDVDL